MSSTQPTSVSNNNNNNNNNALGKSKGKTKKKGEKLEMELFLKNPGTNWAEMMEDEAENVVIPPSQLNLPAAPKAVSNEFDVSQIPHDPPFKAHLRNIQFEVRVEDLYEHFKNVQVKDVQLINERQFCGAVIEFGTRKDLIDAFESTSKNLKGRIFSMSLRDDREKDRGRGTRAGDRGSGFGRDSTPNDWRSSKDAVSVPPASIDPYDHGGGYNRSGGGGSRGGSYGNHDFPPPRNDYNRGGGYDSRPMNDRGYDDRYANRPPRNNDYGGGRSGNWSRDNDPLPQESGFDSAPDDWRHGAPPPQPQYDHRRHHIAGAKSSSDRSPPRYRDQRAMPASRMTDNYRNEDDYNFRQPPVNERRLEDQPPPPPQSTMDRRPAAPRSEDLYEIPRRGDFDQRSGHRNPPLMDHPPRERLSSTRSNISDHLVGEQQQQQQPPSSSLPYDKSANLSPQQAPVVPKDRKPLINASILGALVESISDNKPANYSNSSSIFGDAKPVDTSKKEMEIEKKILSSKPVVAEQTTTTGAAVVSTSPASSSATPPPREDGSVSGPADGQAGNVPPSRSGGEYQDSQIAPRYVRRTNGGIGGNRPMGGGGGGGGGGSGMPPRRDYDQDRNGALGGGRRDGGRMGGPPSGPPRDNRNMRNDLRRGGDGSREFWSGGGGGGGSGQRRFNTDRIGGRIGYNDNMRGPPPPLGSRYDRGMQMRSGGGGGGGGPHGEYENERSRYHSSGSDYIDKDDSEQINYVTSNKYDRLNETEDHGLE